MCRIAHVTTHEVRSSVLHRPGSNNISVVASIQTLRMTGLGEQQGEQQEAEAPEIVSRKHHQSGSQEGEL